MTQILGEGGVSPHAINKPRKEYHLALIQNNHIYIMAPSKTFRYQTYVVSTTLILILNKTMFRCRVYINELAKSKNSQEFLLLCRDETTLKELTTPNESSTSYTSTV